MTAKSPIAPRAQIFMAALLLALGFALVTSLVAADQASAQGSSFCDQYPNDPSCDDDDDDDNNDNDNNNDNDDNDDDSGPGSGPLSGADLNGTGGGSLPFTGYPLSPLLILLLVLLASGMAIRGYVAARDKLAARNTLT